MFTRAPPPEMSRVWCHRFSSVAPHLFATGFGYQTRLLRAPKVFALGRTSPLRLPARAELFLTLAATTRFSCSRGVGRHARHKEINLRILKALASCGVASALEPAGHDVGDGKPPDGATILSTRTDERLRGTTVSHTCAPTYITSTAIPHAAATLAEAHKERKYEALGDRVEFRAVGLETLGAFGNGARSLFDDIAFRIRAATGSAGQESSIVKSPPLFSSTTRRAYWRGTRVVGEQLFSRID